MIRVRNGLFGLIPLGLVAGGCAVGTADSTDDLDPDALGTIEAAVSNTYAIGVVPISNSARESYFGSVCPRETTDPNSGIAQLVGIHMDDEDDHNVSAYTAGWELPQTTVLNYFYTLNSSETNFRFCRVDGSYFKPKTAFTALTSSFYAVLSLGANCPVGSTRTGIYIDNEDDANANSGFGSLSPNSVTSGGTTLYFCLFQAGSGSTSSWPNLGASYGVFHDWEGSQPSWVIQKHSLFTDDEDDNNQNHVVQGTASEQTALRRMVEFGNNTKFDFARVQ